MSLFSLVYSCIWSMIQWSKTLLTNSFIVCRYLNAIQTMCPHILRYLTTAVITNKRRRTVLKDLVKIIQQESYTYKDPITEFLECLYVNFDFDGAQQKLRECETVRSRMGETSLRDNNLLKCLSCTVSDMFYKSCDA